MSKELTPLEALDELRYGGLVKDDVVAFTKKAFEIRLDIIKTALKELEVQRETVGYILTGEDQKRLKAFEIIKEKGCLQYCMLGIGLEDYNRSVDNVNKYDYCLGRYKHYTQEEFDLVKEVLL